MGHVHSTPSGGVGKYGENATPSEGVWEWRKNAPPPEDGSGGGTGSRELEAGNGKREAAFKIGVLAFWKGRSGRDWGNFPIFES